MYKARKKWAYLYMPVFFLLLGYGMFYIIGAPVTNFVSSALEVFLLNDTPTFEAVQPVSIFKEEVVTTEKKLTAEAIEYPNFGEQYGEVVVEKLNLKEKLIFGDRDEDLRHAAGQYTGSVFPGEQGTTLIGGHNSSTFGQLVALKPKETVTIKTNYGTYTYMIDDVEVARHDTDKVLQLLEQRDSDRLILYTCYPVDMLGLTEDRLFIYATLSDGPTIKTGS